MKGKLTTGNILDEIRLIFCLLLYSLIVEIVPKNRPEGQIILNSILDMSKKQSGMTYG